MNWKPLGTLLSLITVMLTRSSLAFKIPLFSKRWNKLFCTSMVDGTTIDDDERIPTAYRKQKAEAGHVYFVATPLGNLGDITYRARDILSSVDVIYAEDTRNTIRLLKYLSIPQKEIHSHHDYNQRDSIDTIVQRAREGASIAVVSDAGTPGISDPGAPLAAALAENLITLHPVPGPSAVISAMSIAGFPNSEFAFFGFIPVKGSERTEKLQAICDTKHSAVIYEAPHRILKTLNDLLQVNSAMRSRYCVCCRELTKLHEEIKRDSIENILVWLKKQQDSKEVSIFCFTYCYFVIYYY
jgi:16S rRNA (cytidine1402-2'-O)-methyltransferase